MSGKEMLDWTRIATFVPASSISKLQKEQKGGDRWQLDRVWRSGAVPWDLSDRELLPETMMRIVFITFSSSLVPLMVGLCRSNPYEFQFSGLRRNRIDDLGISSPSLWPTEPRLHVRSKKETKDFIRTMMGWGAQQWPTKQRRKQAAKGTWPVMICWCTMNAGEGKILVRTSASIHSAVCAQGCELDRGGEDEFTHEIMLVPGNCDANQHQSIPAHSWVHQWSHGSSQLIQYVTEVRHNVLSGKHLFLSRKLRILDELRIRPNKIGSRYRNKICEVPTMPFLGAVSLKAQLKKKWWQKEMAVEVQKRRMNKCWNDGI